jgi:hypothetical protein
MLETLDDGLTKRFVILERSLPEENRKDKRGFLVSCFLRVRCGNAPSDAGGSQVTRPFLAALACFSAAALHLKAREKWIGWTPRQRARRLGFVVNNSRYLVLPERERLPNLATLRNLAIGLYEIERYRDRVDANGLKSWRRRMTVADALHLLRSSLRPVLEQGML